jgi:FtsZ-interacting cell division protein ZipA
MSTWLIVVIVVVVVILIGLLLVAPRMRERARLRKRERELEQRREQVVDEHRQEAAGRERQAEVAEQRARVAAQEAERQRAEARLAQEKAKLHERGLADHELIDDRERPHFAGTSAAEPTPEGTSGTVVGDEPTMDSADDRPRAGTTAYQEGRAAAHEPSRAEDFDAGRRREERE